MENVLKVGDSVDTLFGELIMTSWNGSIAWFDEYEINDDDELERIGERVLTKEEIAHVMHEYDGKNHRMSIEDIY